MSIFRKFLTISIFAIIVCCFAACSCAKRMQRLRVYCPECFTTETIRDTVILPEFRTDTAFVFRSDTDTVVIERDRLKLRLVRVHDTVTLRATVPADTVVRTVTVEKLIQPPKGGVGFDRTVTILKLLIMLTAVTGFVAILWRGNHNK